MIKGGSSRSKGTDRISPTDQDEESDELIPELIEDGPKKCLANEGSAIESVGKTQEVESPKPPGVDAEQPYSKHLNDKVTARGTTVGEGQIGAAAAAADGKPKSAFNAYADEPNNLSALDAPAGEGVSLLRSTVGIQHILDGLRLYFWYKPPVNEQNSIIKECYSIVM